MVNVSEAITGLAGLGTDLGAFLTNITPGVVGIIVVLSIIGGVVAIIFAVVKVIKNALSKTPNSGK